MEAWSIAEHALRRCADLRAQAARDRLARLVGPRPRGEGRRRIARMLRAVGSMLVEAGDRVLDDATPAAN